MDINGKRDPAWPHGRCPACERFVSRARECPYCGTHVPRSREQRLLFHLALWGSLVGLGVIYLLVNSQ